MDCKIVLKNQTDLWCTTHQVGSMSAICEAAEQALRDRIEYLEAIIERVGLNKPLFPPSEP